MGMRVVLDAEFDSLDPTRVWVVGCKDIDEGSYYEFFDVSEFTDFLTDVDLVIGHNLIGYDVPCLKRLWGVEIPKEKVCDTLVLSRLVWYGKPGGHSVDSWGSSFGMSKVFVSIYDDPSQMPLYRDRCRYDVEIQCKIWEDLSKFYYDPQWEQSVRVEHELAYICREMEVNGFAFNKTEAEKTLDEITNEMWALEKEITESVADVVDEVKTYKIKKKLDGSYDKKSRGLLDSNSGVLSWDGSEYRVTTYRPFNPASPKDRIELLNASGWKPFNKTKGHLEAERKKQWTKLKKFKVYGWKCDEDNLATLPSDAPTGARRLAEWLVLEGRRSDLVEWLDAYDVDSGRIHGRFNHIGSWTGRCSHSKPNQANIFSEFHLPKGKSPDDLTAVERIKYKYDGRLRALWCVPEGCFLVGCDAEGIQLRVLAHLMGDEDYIKAVSEGRKEDQTDVHNINRRALGLKHLGRDDAKTFIYAWLLGAGLGKVGSILRCSTRIAGRAVSDFVQRFPGLRKLKEETIPSDAKRGFFGGLDGRLVVCSSEHLMLAGYLQNGEKVIMAHALVEWYTKAKERGLKFKLVDFVHDEWQVECYDKETAECLGLLMCDALSNAGKKLGMNIPITGEYRIGTNWRETH